MLRIIDSRDTGKTKKLLTDCAKDHGVYICKHPERIDEKCEAYGIQKVTAMGYNEYASIANNVMENVYIDELEEFVKNVYPELTGYTLTKED